ncbi:MAG: polysaccharide biosynthesis C-terminal domain-containing protein [Bacteroidales bacterium]|jgi:O-antigen/teichoic acid export membrane protein|nr:polysaccharide biosynthesis C-terminal domain-containing protein [Bacteroidales bacterium]
MDNKKVKINSIITILVRGIILLINFAIVVCQTRFWGSEGKGILAIFTADLGLILYVSNIFTNSSVSYFAKKVGPSKLFFQSVLWCFIASTIGAFVSYFFSTNSIPLLLFISSILFGWLTFYSSVFVGFQKINYFNLFTLMQPLLLLGLLLLFKFTFEPSYYAYFYAQIISLAISIIVAKIIYFKKNGKLKIILERKIIKQSFVYGFKNELSGFLQFVVYRLGYYFLIYFSGKASVGIFALGIAISESVWVFSRSISMVQFSKIIGEEDTKKAKKDNLSAAKISFIISLICITIIMILPKFLFSFIFGNDFLEIQSYVLLLSPGILIISFSNVIDHYFAAIDKQKILILKSAAGTVATIILSIILIPSLDIIGACITYSISHIICSLVTILYFFHTKSEKLR